MLNFLCESDVFDDIFEIGTVLPFIFMGIFILVFLVIIITSIVKSAKRRKNQDDTNFYNNNRRKYRTHHRNSSIDPFDHTGNTDPFADFGSGAGANNGGSNGYGNQYGDYGANCVPPYGVAPTGNADQNSSNGQSQNPNVCPYCGGNTEGGNFCPYCGRKLK